MHGQRPSRGRGPADRSNGRPDGRDADGKAADETALDFAIALRDRPADDVLADKLAAWLAADAAHRAAWREVRALMALTDAAGAERRMASSDPMSAPASAPVPAPVSGTASGDASHPMPERPARSLAGGRRPGRVSRPRRVTAGLCAAAVLTLAVIGSMVPGPKADFETGMGELRAVSLPDGSRLDLAAESAVALSFDAERRIVDLIDGAVFATVVPDPTRPFTIRAGVLEGTAVGTAFEVRRLDAGARLAVAEGVVRVHRPLTADPGRDTALGATRLVAGEWVRAGADATRALARGRQSTASVASWRDGVLSVTDWPVADVVDAIRDQFPGTILVLGSAAAGTRVTGVYDLSRPLRALRAVAHPHGFVVRPFGDWLIVLSPV